MTNNITDIGGGHEVVFGSEEKNRTDTEKPGSQIFQKMFEEADRNLKNADQAVLEANSGGPVNLHEMMIALEKADISLRLLVQVRNKAVEAYKEMMRIQV